MGVRCGDLLGDAVFGKGIETSLHAAIHDHMCLDVS